MLLGLLLNLAIASTVKVLVIDTGVAPISSIKQYLPKMTSGPDYIDDYNHGTSMAYLIAKGDDGKDPLDAKRVYIESCNIYYTPKRLIVIGPHDLNSSFPVFAEDVRYTNAFVLELTAQCLKKALEEGFHFINLSFSGSTHSNIERILLKRLDAKGVKMTISAGNISADLNKRCDQYPICYVQELNLKNAIGVGAGMATKPCSYSNFAKWLQWVESCDLKTVSNKDQKGIIKGTSGAAALYLHNWIKQELRRKLDHE